MFYSHPLFQLLQGPGCDAFPGLPLVAAHSEGTLWWRPHSLGYRSEERPDSCDNVTVCQHAQSLIWVFTLCLFQPLSLQTWIHLFFNCTMVSTLDQILSSVVTLNFTLFLFSMFILSWNKHFFKILFSYLTETVSTITASTIKVSPKHSKIS